MSEKFIETYTFENGIQKSLEKYTPGSGGGEAGITTVTSMPLEAELDDVVYYIGENTDKYKKYHFYKLVQDPSNRIGCYYEQTSNRYVYYENGKNPDGQDNNMADISNKRPLKYGNFEVATSTNQLTEVPKWTPNGAASGYGQYGYVGLYTEYGYQSFKRQPIEFDLVGVLPPYWKDISEEKGITYITDGDFPIKNPSKDQIIVPIWDFDYSDLSFKAGHFYRCVIHEYTRFRCYKYHYEEYEEDWFVYLDTDNPNTLSKVYMVNDYEHPSGDEMLIMGNAQVRSYSSSTGTVTVYFDWGQGEEETLVMTRDQEGDLYGCPVEWRDISNDNTSCLEIIKLNVLPENPENGDIYLYNGSAGAYTPGRIYRYKNEQETYNGLMFHLPGDWDTLADTEGKIMGEATSSTTFNKYADVENPKTINGVQYNLYVDWDSGGYVYASTNGYQNAYRVHFNSNGVWSLMGSFYPGRSTSSINEIAFGSIRQNLSRWVDVSSPVAISIDELNSVLSI